MCSYSCVFTVWMYLCVCVCILMFLHSENIFIFSHLYSVNILHGIFTLWGYQGADFFFFDTHSPTQLFYCTSILWCGVQPRSTFTLWGYQGADIFFRCVFFFGSQRLMPPWSSFLRITLTTPPKVWFCYTTSLHYFTTLLYYTTLLHYFTTLLYYTTLLHYFTTLLYYTTLLHYFTTLLYYTTLLDHSYHTPESGGAWTRKSWCRGYN